MSKLFLVVQKWADIPKDFLPLDAPELAPFACSSARLQNRY